MASDPQPDFKITDYNYIGSAVGNAFFSGIGFDMLWECVSNANTREKFDANVSAAISAKERLDKLVGTKYE